MATVPTEAGLSDDAAQPGAGPGRRRFWALTLGSIGVVYGDIGTSPLYAVREAVLAAAGPSTSAGEEIILGILSLIVWALILVVSIKYVIILLRADNNGEGGTLALMALAQRATRGHGLVVVALGMISAALFYGDAMITPALSVLSAVEGLKVMAPALEAYVVPLAVLILFALFAVQSHGTARVATFFGPITLVWFIAIATAGAWHVAQNPNVLDAFNPAHGVSFLLNHGVIGLLTLGAVFLVVTGAEALYAVEIRHTSEAQFGQIYMPRVNTLLLLGVLLLVILFKSSGALASAYGIAVTGTMVVTAILALIVIWRYWNWPLWAAAALMVPFLFIDLIFLGANLLKVFQGGWVPLLIAAIIITIMLTWRRGARVLAEKTRRLETPIDSLIESLEKRELCRVPGTAVFLTADPDSAPTALLHSLKHYKVLHQRNVVLTMITEATPRVPLTERVSIEPLGGSFQRVLLRFGFMETPNVPKALGLARKEGLTFDIMSTSFFLSRRSVRIDPRSGMRPWQDRIFILLARNADDASSYFQLPTDRVVEIGTQVSV